MRPPKAQLTSSAASPPSGPSLRHSRAGRWCWCSPRLPGAHCSHQPHHTLLCGSRRCCWLQQRCLRDPCCHGVLRCCTAGRLIRGLRAPGCCCCCADKGAGSGCSGSAPLRESSLLPWKAAGLLGQLSTVPARSHGGRCDSSVQVAPETPAAQPWQAAAVHLRSGTLVCTPALQCIGGAVSSGGHSAAAQMQATVQQCQCRPGWRRNV
jgi:hypothetical protein